MNFGKSEGEEAFANSLSQAAGNKSCNVANLAISCLSSLGPAGEISHAGWKGGKKGRERGKRCETLFFLSFSPLLQRKQELPTSNHPEKSLDAPCSTFQGIPPHSLSSGEPKNPLPSTTLYSQLLEPTTPGGKQKINLPSFFARACGNPTRNSLEISREEE